MEIYRLSIIGLALLCVIVPAMGFLVGPLKGKLGLVGGPVTGKGEESLVFRADRAQGNSAEAIPPFLAAAILAMLVGVGAGFLAALVWGFLAVRLIYVAIYLRGGAAAKGGNLRSLLHVLGSLATFIVIGAVIVKVL